MGVHKNIGFNKFPEQGSLLNKEVNVCFNYETSNRLKGIIIRDDKEEPYLTLIKLEDNRVVTETECQYQPL